MTSSRTRSGPTRSPNSLVRSITRPSICAWSSRLTRAPSRVTDHREPRMGEPKSNRARTPFVKMTYGGTSRIEALVAPDGRLGPRQDPVEERRAAAPMLLEDAPIGPPQDVSEHEGRDDGVVQRAEHGDDLGHQV